MESKKRALLNRITEGEALPALSPLAIQLVELAANDEASASDLASIIEKDPGLATRLLKMVGSAFFRTTTPPASVTQAVVRLGFKRVRIMALSLSLRETFPMDDDAGIDYGLYWKTSLYRALVAHDFSQALDGVQPDEAFVAGLISEIGMLMLYHVCEPEDKKNFPGNDRSLQEILEWEEARFDINHKDIGAIVLEQWSFPDILVQAQQCYGAKAFEPGTPLMCRAVELACQATEIAYEHTAELHRLQQMALDRLKIEPETVTTILVSAFSRVEELAKHLMVKVDSQNDIISVMEKANQALARMNSSIESSFQSMVDHMGADNSQQKTLIQENADVMQNTLDAVAHEIRNPLLAIGGFAKRLAEEGKEPYQGKKYAQIIADESCRLEQVLNDIMVFCQSYKPRRVEVDLIPLVDNLLDALQERIYQKKIAIVRRFPDKAISLRLDGAKIGETLTRLLELASAMAEQGGHTVTVSIEQESDTGKVSIKIEDDGRPLPRETQDALLSGNLTAKALGSVLKLSLARKIIEAHQGQIALNVEKGRGNTMSVSLPVL